MTRTPGKPAAFTLLEVVLAMAVIGLLVAGLAGISTSSLRLGRAVLDAQAEESVRDSFNRLMRENLSEMPASARVYLAQGNMTRGGQQLILEGVTGMFPVAGVPLVMDSVVVDTRRDRSGNLAMYLLYYDGPYWQDLQNNVVEDDLMVEVPLRDGFELLEWRVYDPVKEEWFTEWEEGGRRPHFLELGYRMAGEDRDRRMTVWLPRLQTDLRQRNTPGGGGGPTPDGGAGGSPDQPVGAPGGPGGGVPSAPPGVRVEVRQ